MGEVTGLMINQLPGRNNDVLELTDLIAGQGADGLTRRGILGDVVAKAIGNRLRIPGPAVTSDDSKPFEGSSESAPTDEAVEWYIGQIQNAGVFVKPLTVFFINSSSGIGGDEESPQHSWIYISGTATTSDIQIVRFSSRHVSYNMMESHSNGAGLTAATFADASNPTLSEVQNYIDSNSQVQNGDFLLYNSPEGLWIFRPIGGITSSQGNIIISRQPVVIPPSTGTGKGHFSQTFGNLTISGEYTGATAPVVTKENDGQYKVKPAVGVSLDWMNVTGNNSPGTLTPTNELVIIFDNESNSFARRFKTQQQTGNGGDVNANAIGTNGTTLIASNTSTITYPGMNGFGSDGYHLILG